MSEGAHADFTGDLSGRIMSGQDLTGIIFRDADLRGARFDETLLRGAVFENCHAAEASFARSDCQQMRARAGSFYRASFQGTDLRDAVFERCVLAGADLRGAHLTGITVTLDCNSFEGVRIGRAASAELAFLFSRMQSPLRERWLELLGERDRAWLEGVFSR